MSSTLDLRIKKDDTLFDIERYNSQLFNNVRKVRMNLPRNYETKLFNDSWISSLIATAALEGKHLTLTDVYENSDVSNIAEHFSKSLVGITSVCLANEIENSKHEKLKFDIHNIIERVAFKKGGLIDDWTSGHTVTFCSFDSKNSEMDYPRPLALSAETKDEFTEKFLRIKRDKIDKVFGGKNYYQRTLFEESSTYEKEKSFANLIYELYENTLQHGNKNEKSELIEGVRAFSIKKHISENEENLKQQAQNFNELEKYLGKRTHRKFYEISITDNGIGIIKRFLASRPDYNSDIDFTQLTDLEKINFIIEKSLSSKLFSGAGQGIKGALRSIQELNGFLSLRTNDLWIYFDGTDSLKDFSFNPVRTSMKLFDKRGTSYNILIPIAS